VCNSFQNNGRIQATADVAKEVVQLADEPTVTTYCLLNFVKRRADVVGRQQRQAQQTAIESNSFEFTL